MSRRVTHPTDGGLPCRFNPLLGFLGVSTIPVGEGDMRRFMFQSLAGFSRCLDLLIRIVRLALLCRFNPLLGFLGVSTTLPPLRVRVRFCFNPLLGFLGVSTLSESSWPAVRLAFQSLAGFSRCLDVPRQPLLSSTQFQSLAGFSRCLDRTPSYRQSRHTTVSIPCWVF